MTFDNVLYVIGNGFDLHHGVECSYGHFKRWMREHDPDLFQVYNAVCAYEGLWSDFERGMAYVQRDYFMDCASAFLPDERVDPDDWQMADIVLAGDVARGAADELLCSLKHDFSMWISSIRPPSFYKDMMLYVDNYARFLTFNYTPFLEKYYKLEADRVLHIHGVAKRGGSEGLVVGHGGDMEAYDKWCAAKKHRRRGRRDSTYEAYFGNKRDFPEYEYMVEGAETYYEASWKPVERIISSHEAYFSALADISVIYVWGFSFSAIDAPYLQAIISHSASPEEITWHVSYHTCADKQRTINCLSGMGISADRIFLEPLSKYQRKRCWPGRRGALQDTTRRRIAGSA